MEDVKFVEAPLLTAGLIDGKTGMMSHSVTAFPTLLSTKSLNHSFVPDLPQPALLQQFEEGGLVNPVFIHRIQSDHSFKASSSLSSFSSDPLVGLDVEKSPLTQSLSEDVLTGGGLSSDGLMQNLQDLHRIDQFVNAVRELGSAQVLDQLKLVATPDLTDWLNSGLGSSDRSSGIGRIPHRPTNPLQNYEDGSGFNDPLNGHRQPRPRSTLVGAGQIPGANSLVSQQQDHGNPVRQREWSSGDGLTTWSHTTYEDGARTATRTDRHPDGSITEWVMTWGTNGQVESFVSAHNSTDGHIAVETTIFREDGSKVTHGHEVDENGAIVRQWGTDFEKPNQGEGAPKGGKTDIAGYQPVDDAGGGSNYNPFTGQYWGSKIILSADRVNPNPDAPTLGETSQLLINPLDLVINPTPDTVAPSRNYNPHQFDSRDRINPGRL